MSEKAFIVKPGSDLYNQYFGAREETLKFNDLAREFNGKYNVCKSNVFSLSQYLSAKMDYEDRNRFASDIRQKYSKWGLTEFKVQSKMQKLWEEEVACNVDFRLIHDHRSWFFNYACGGGRWSYNMWHHGDTVYGYLEVKDGGEIILSDDMEEIKLSEYYKAMEQVEEEQTHD